MIKTKQMMWYSCVYMEVYTANESFEVNEHRGATYYCRAWQQL